MCNRSQLKQSSGSHPFSKRCPMFPLNSNLFNRFAAAREVLPSWLRKKMENGCDILSTSASATCFWGRNWKFGSATRARFVSLEDTQGRKAQKSQGWFPKHRQCLLCLKNKELKTQNVFAWEMAAPLPYRVQQLSSTILYDFFSFWPIFCIKRISISLQKQLDKDDKKIKKWGGESVGAAFSEGDAYKQLYWGM